MIHFGRLPRLIFGPCGAQGAAPSDAALAETVSAVAAAIENAQATPRERVRAVFEYNQAGEGFLNMKVGDVIVVTEKTEPEGWWKGFVFDQARGEQHPDNLAGMFPSNYAEALPTSSEPEAAAAASGPVVPAGRREYIPEELAVQKIEAALLTIAEDELPGWRGAKKNRNKAKAIRKFSPQAGSNGYLTILQNDILIISGAV